MKTNQIISSNGNTITLKLNEFNGLMGPILDDNLPSSFSPSLSSTIFETASFSALDVNNLTNMESSIATSQETPVIVAKTSGLSEDLSKNLYLSKVNNSSTSSTTNSLDTIAINEFTQLIGPIPPDDYIKSSSLPVISFSTFKVNSLTAVAAQEISVLQNLTKSVELPNINTSDLNFSFASKYDPVAKKIGSDLAQLNQEYEISLRQRTSLPFEASNPLVQLSEDGNKVIIDFVAAGDTESLLADLKDLGLENAASFGRVVSGELPIDQLEAIAGLKSLNFARPAYQPIYNIGATTSQGDVSMRSDIARTTYGVDGSGVTVGVLSDSYNFLGGAAADIASGDLPGPGNPFGHTTPVNVLDDDGQTDEGRAMLQLIHDVAPGANLAFHTANGGLADFAQGIIDLANAGSDVIVDDVTKFAEPFFQDGIIAQAANAVVNAGVPFFSSAGNQARQSYQSLFNPAGTVTINGDPYLVQDFNPGSGVDILQNFVLNSSESIRLSFQWDQPHASAGGVGSANDLDIFVVNSAGTIVGGSANGNIGGDPVEIVSFQNTGATGVFSLLIGQWLPGGGPAPGLIKYVDFARGTNDAEYHTLSSTIFGHHNAVGASAVGAAFYGQTPVFGTNPPLLEPFSSVGGTPILFNTAGNRLTNPIIPEQPRIVAPDGTNTTFFTEDIPEDSDNFPNFFGTSAAAPHAAAVAALMLDAVPGKSPANIYTALESTAINMGVAGPDFDSGFGLIRADAAIAALLPSATIAIAKTTDGREAGPVSSVFTLTRTGSTAAPLNVSYTLAGSATRGSDYSGTSPGTATFAVGATTTTITLPTINDTEVDANETIIATIAAPTGYTISGPASATATIVDDDIPNGGGGGTDIDGDGKGDILWRNKATGQNVVWYSGDGNNIKSLTTVTNLHWKMAGASDIDGDGKGDILWRNEATGQNTVWYGGDGNNIKSLIPVTNLHWKMAGGSDIDGDGKGDILWRNEATGQNTVWYGGDGNNIKSLTPVTNLNWKMAGGSDIDGDGKGDILWRNEATGQNVVWYGGESKNIASLTTVTNLNWEMIA